MQENQLLFDRIRYEISSHQILLQINTKQGMPITWKQVKRAKRGKDYFLLIISKVHIIYLPDSIFNSKHEIKFLETILERKALV
jgi:hypothetical protein